MGKPLLGDDRQVKAELEKLIELQKTDTNIRRLKKQIDTAEQRRAEIEQEFEQHASSIREIQGRRDKLQTERADLEKQIVDNKTYLERADRNLKHAQNQKEYETAMREMDALQKQIAAFETQTVEKMTAIEDVEKELEERADEINTIDSKRAEALKAFDAELKVNRTEFESETQNRETVFATLPVQLASVYNRLAQRSRDGIAVAEVVNGSCSACFMSLRPQMQVEVRKGQQIITCESCTRILYIPRKEEQSEAVA
jgi:predicted  nucleic acid-binding Zn-ribbon protein